MQDMKMVWDKHCLKCKIKCKTRRNTQLYRSRKKRGNTEAQK
uniref:Uncharacterized protein n=1 Tax=Arundo donax TaxID=35708 RepID=A0A0A8YTF3_ARUDO